MRCWPGTTISTDKLSIPNSTDLESVMSWLPAEGATTLTRSIYLSTCQQCRHNQATRPPLAPLPKGRNDPRLRLSYNAHMSANPSFATVRGRVWNGSLFSTAFVFTVLAAVSQVSAAPP